MKTNRTALFALAALLGASTPVWAVGVTATFDDLPSPPATDSATALFYANNNSSVYQGITWDSRFDVVGGSYAIGTTPYGVPHSGDYFVSNGVSDSNIPDSNDALTITTSMVLTGAWFGQNQYYGYGPGGADQVTIKALNGSVVLGSVVFNLPAPSCDQSLNPPCSGTAMGFVDTSSFASLAGITGYEIDRNEVGAPYGGNWVADDFTFVSPSAVPEPETYAMLLAGLGMLGWARKRSRKQA